MPGRIKLEPEEDAAVSVTASITGASMIGSTGLPATAADAATANAVARANFFIVLPHFLAKYDILARPKPDADNIVNISIQVKHAIIRLHSLRNIMSNQQHLCANFRQFKQFSDVFIIQANAAIG